MAHKVINGKVVVDWINGDPEGDRIYLLRAYRDFIKEIKESLDNAKTDADCLREIQEIFEKWQINTENQIDKVPRIWITRPN